MNRVSPRGVKRFPQRSERNAIALKQDRRLSSSPKVFSGTRWRHTLCRDAVLLRMRCCKVHLLRPCAGWVLAILLAKNQRCGREKSIRIHLCCWTVLAIGVGVPFLPRKEKKGSPQLLGNSQIICPALVKYERSQSSCRKVLRVTD